jgi:anti-anti-sigma factor
MEIKIKDNGVNARVEFTGRLDAGGVTAVSVPFNAVVETKRGVVVDLSGMTFLTSNGIRMLTAAAKSLTRRGGRLVLLNPTALVSEVLAVTGMDSIMPVVRSEQDAEGLLTME